MSRHLVAAGVSFDPHDPNWYVAKRRGRQLMIVSGPYEDRGEAEKWARIMDELEVERSDRPAPSIW